ncbi:MAG: hypothetical protein J6W81_01445 [Lentisphaeria bacterium]|nr:hypothetical protein [Lentisphaeria bacterium]
MSVALSLDPEGNIAGSLGKGVELLIISADDKRIRIPSEWPVVSLLKKYSVDCLICGKIGNCTLELLELEKIQVVPGVSGEAEMVFAQWQNGKLETDDKFTCADAGMTCGYCRGKF